MLYNILKELIKNLNTSKVLPYNSPFWIFINDSLYYKQVKVEPWKR